MSHRIRRAFTIIELLVVIAIISILVTLGFLVAGKVSGSGKVDVTKKTLQVLEQALAAYTAQNGSIPPSTVADPRPGAANRLIPIVDGRNMSANKEFINTVGLFMLQCKNDSPDAAAKLRDLDTKLVHEFDPDQTDSNSQSPNIAQQPHLLTAFDGWKNPIRYVHPTFKGRIVRDPGDTTNLQSVDLVGRYGPPPPGKTYGIQLVRRTDATFDADLTIGPPPDPPIQRDSDGGLPIGASPYFYSCGPDGDPSTTEDNIYTNDNRPRLPK